ncbi:hypothetical protein Fmac_026184 [Flemingia macrophylla]|uniref:Uncharacterized protein n=1 Tax=Flemingia macrophylla TaxID=520843 RepID=A0ABD1LE51_9FABA
MLKFDLDKYAKQVGSKSSSNCRAASPWPGPPDYKNWNRETKHQGRNTTDTLQSVSVTAVCRRIQFQSYGSH